MNDAFAPRGILLSGFSRRSTVPCAVVLLAAALVLWSGGGCRTAPPADTDFILHPDSAEEFNELISGEAPVLAVFVSEGCGTCRLIGPTLSKLAEDYAGKLDVVEADLGLMGEFISEYDLVKVPTVIVFHEGVEIRRRQGVLPAPFMRGFINEALADVRKR